MHLTANQRASRREFVRRSVECAVGDAERSAGVV
jgi:hypothetical protein